jgi:hypothetical protein
VRPVECLAGGITPKTQDSEKVNGAAFRQDRPSFIALVPIQSVMAGHCILPKGNYSGSSVTLRCTKRQDSQWDLSWKYDRTYGARAVKCSSLFCAMMWNLFQEVAMS